MHSTRTAPPLPEARFIRRATRWTRPGLCPELQLALAPAPDALWRSQERAFGAGRPFPYWSVAWPAGEALARVLLDTPTLVRGASVLDLGAGSGIAAIAAARAGARRVVACDSDPFARLSISRNALRNQALVETADAGILQTALEWDVVLGADLWYEPFFARAATAWLDRQARRGARVLVADSGRAHFRRPTHAPLARFQVPASPRLEPGPEVTVAVWQLGAHPVGAAVAC